MFLAGEFSNISRVSKRSLQFYDRIGLFEPAYIDEANGYRYYAAEQLAQLNQILVLKDLGLSLDQIQTMLQSEISDDEIHGMLRLKKAEKEQAIHEELARLHRIEVRLNQNRSVDQTLNVAIKSIPEQQILTVRQTFATEAELFSLINQIMTLVPQTVNPRILGQFIGVFWDESFLTNNTDVELGYLLKKEIDCSIDINPSTIAEVRTLPAVDMMASTVQPSGHGTDFIGLGRIAAWMASHDYMIAGPYREIVFAAQSPTELEGSTIEIQMPITKMNESRRNIHAD